MHRATFAASVQNIDACTLLIQAYDIRKTINIKGWSIFVYSFSNLHKVQIKVGGWVEKQQQEGDIPD